jgi:hypothetical protein
MGGGDPGQEGKNQPMQGSVTESRNDAFGGSAWPGTAQALQKMNATTSEHYDFKISTNCDGLLP